MLGGNTADSFSGLFYLCGRYTRKNKLKKMLVLLFTFGDCKLCWVFLLMWSAFLPSSPYFKSKLKVLCVMCYVTLCFRQVSLSLSTYYWVY